MTEHDCLKNDLGCSDKVILTICPEAKTLIEALRKKSNGH